MKSKVTSALLVPASTTEYAQTGTINSLANAFQDSQVSCATPKLTSAYPTHATSFTQPAKTKSVPFRVNATPDTLARLAQKKSTNARVHHVKMVFVWIKRTSTLAIVFQVGPVKIVS